MLPPTKQSSHKTVPVPGPAGRVKFPHGPPLRRRARARRYEETTAGRFATTRAHIPLPEGSIRKRRVATSTTPRVPESPRARTHTHIYAHTQSHPSRGQR